MKHHLFVYLTLKHSCFSERRRQSRVGYSERMKTNRTDWNDDRGLKPSSEASTVRPVRHENTQRTCFHLWSLADKVFTAQSSLAHVFSGAAASTHWTVSVSTQQLHPSAGITHHLSQPPSPSPPASENLYPSTESPIDFLLQR